MFETWADVLANSLQNLWYSVLSFIPNVLGALVVFVLGLVVASGLGTLVEKVFEALRLDMFLERMGLKPYFERAGLRMRGAFFLGEVVKWFLIIAFLQAALSIVQLGTLSSFLGEVTNYITNNLLGGVLIMLAAVVLANFLSRVVTASVSSAKLHGAKFLGTLTWWAVVVFGLLSALIQLNVAVAVIQSLITGLIAMFAIAGGIAFGLGGKEYAAHLINKLRDVTERD